MGMVMVMEIMVVVVRFFWDSFEGKSGDRLLELSRTQLGKKRNQIEFWDPYILHCNIFRGHYYHGIKTVQITSQTKNI